MTTTDNTLQQRLPDLPKDIGRLIFEHLASSGSGTPYALVSKEVQRWVEPIIYHQVVLKTYEKITLFHQIIVTFASSPASNKPADFFGAHVKLLVLYAGDHPHLSVAEIIHACSSIQSCAVISASHDVGLSFSDLSMMHPWKTSPKHLSLILADLKNPYITDSLFKNVTHLELKYWASSKADLYLAGGAGPRMPYLTHLSIATHPFEAYPQNLGSTARDIIRRLPITIQVFLFVIFPHPGWRGFWEGIREIGQGNLDPRAVVLIDLDQNQCLPEWALDETTRRMTICMTDFRIKRDEQWEGLGAVDNGYWKEAEAIVARRKEMKEGGRALAG